MYENRERKQKPKQKRKRNIRKGRIAILVVSTLSALVFVGVFRVSIIKAGKGDEFEKNAIENQINKVGDQIINPNRGTILDRNGQAIAISSTVFNVALDIRLIAEEEQADIDKTLNIISEIVGIERATLDAYFIKDTNGKLKPENDTHWKIIAKKIPYDKAKELEAKLKEESLIGVNLETDTLRNYPHNEFAAQTLGFIMGDTKWGLESVYDKYLTGTPGRIYRTLEDTNYVETTDIEPTKGTDIVTTLDFTLQKEAERIVEETYKGFSPEYTPEAVELILMNPQTGEILSMAQYPTFNSNDPDEISLLDDANFSAEFEKLSEEEQLKIKNETWKNLAISNTFEPGSTFKANVVAAGLEEGVITENETFYCEGYKMIGGYKIRCHKRSGHGQINVEQALAQSCNMAMIDIGNKLGRENFYKYQIDFGFGQKTGIDLYGETDAANLIVPVENLNSTELATSSFGQTFTSTPIQMITAFAATINGGNLLKPYLVSQVIDEDGKVIEETSPEVVRKVLSEGTSDFLKEAMVTTLDEGSTGYRAKIDGYEIGGKTGTAQQGVRSENIYTLSFAAYLPAENPEYLALGIIHKPKNYYTAPAGAVSPSPMIKEFMQSIINYKAIPPSNPNEQEDEGSPLVDGISLEDFTNKSLQDTIKILNKDGIDFKLVGSGGDTVVKQIPAANTKIDKDTKVLLYIESKDSEKKLKAVPDTFGLTLDEAKKLIEDMGFEVSVSEIVDTEKQDTLEEGADEPVTPYLEKLENGENEETSEKQANTEPVKKVVEQIPEAGVFIEEGSIIKIRVK